MQGAVSPPTAIQYRMETVDNEPRKMIYYYLLSIIRDLIAN